MKINPKKFSDLLLKWYDQNGRDDLPWRKNISPYRVWLSEIMLQQTQVATVLPYFQRFLEQFPTIQDLANTDEDEVMHLWSGLGYYSRARNLHQTAKAIVTHYAGQFPPDLNALQNLPGIGRSTAGAICAIAFQQATAILDGNVKRVLTRLHALDGWPGDSQMTKKLWELAETYTPTQRTGDYTQAIMDLGATVCTRSKPNCQACPLKKHCQAHQLGRETHYPESKPSKVLPTKEIVFLILFNDKKQILLEKRPPVGIWSGLWSLPECQSDDYDKRLVKWCRVNYGCIVQHIDTLPTIKHSFSHFHLHIIPVKCLITDWDSKISDGKLTTWYDFKSNNKIGLAAPVHKLLKQIGETLHDSSSLLPQTA